MQLSTMELLIVSVGLSIDVFVAAAYMGAGFSKIRWKNLVLLSVLFGGIQLGVLVLGNLITLLPLLSITRTKTAADRWEGLTVLIFAALGIYMILKGIRKKKVLERRKDEIEWKKTTLLALVTSVDAFFVGMGLGFLDTAMIEESLVLFPVTVLEAVDRYICRIQTGTERKQTCILGRGSTPFTCQFRRNSPLLYVKNGAI